MTQNEKRIDITNFISKKINKDFTYLKEVSNRYNFNIGFISIHSSEQLSLKNMLRASDKVIEIKIKDTYYYFVFLMFVENDSLYEVVKKIEKENDKIEIYFELISRDTREHIKNFIDSLYFSS